MRQKQRMEEKLDAFLANQILETEFEHDSKAEGEGEHSAVTKAEEAEEIGGTETSTMEIDDAGEDKVMAADDLHPSARKKRVPSLPLKPFNKRVGAGTATQGNMGHQARKGTDMKASVSCKRCIHQGITSNWQWRQMRKL